MELVADKGLPYDGRRVKKGELFTVNRRAHANVLIAIGKAHAASPSEIEAHKEAKKAEKLKAKMARSQSGVLVEPPRIPVPPDLKSVVGVESPKIPVPPDLKSGGGVEPKEESGPANSQNRRRRGRHRINSGAGG